MLERKLSTLAGPTSLLLEISARRYNRKMAQESPIYLLMSITGHSKLAADESVVRPIPRLAHRCSRAGPGDDCLRSLFGYEPSGYHARANQCQPH